MTSGPRQAGISWGPASACVLEATQRALVATEVPRQLVEREAGRKGGTRGIAGRDNDENAHARGFGRGATAVRLALPSEKAAFVNWCRCIRSTADAFVLWESVNLQTSVHKETGSDSFRSSSCAKMMRWHIRLSPSLPLSLFRETVSPAEAPEERRRSARPRLPHRCCPPPPFRLTSESFT